MSKNNNLTNPEKEVKRIISGVAKYYDYNYDDIISRSRTAYLVRARHLAMHLARAFTKVTSTHCGYIFDRDHGTIIYGARKGEAYVTDEILENLNLKEMVRFERVYEEGE